MADNDSRSPSPILQFKTKVVNKINILNQEQVDIAQQLRKLPPLPKSIHQTYRNKLLEEKEIELINIENNLKKENSKNISNQFQNKVINNAYINQHNKIKKKNSQQPIAKNSHAKDGSRLTKQSASLGDDDSDENDKWF